MSFELSTNHDRYLKTNVSHLFPRSFVNSILASMLSRRNTRVSDTRLLYAGCQPRTQYNPSLTSILARFPDANLPGVAPHSGQRYTENNSDRQ